MVSKEACIIVECVNVATAWGSLFLYKPGELQRIGTPRGSIGLTQFIKFAWMQLLMFVARILVLRAVTRIERF